MYKLHLLISSFLYDLRSFVTEQWKGALVGSILSWFILSIFGGLIENYAVELWVNTITPWLVEPANINNAILLLLGFTLLFCFVYIVLFLYRRSEDSYEGIRISLISSLMMKLRNEDITKYQKLMDDINLLLQHSLEETTDKALGTFIEKTFQNIFKSLGQTIIDGAGILIPDPTDSNWLAFWQVNASQKRSNKKFFIGPNELVSIDNARGVAGYVYLENKPDITNIMNRSTGEADNPRFHTFDMSIIGQSRFNVPYDSFICLPIRWKNKAIGVLSIESQVKYSFDKESKVRLQPIANQIGTILYLYGKVK